MNKREAAIALVDHLLDMGRNAFNGHPQSAVMTADEADTLIDRAKELYDVPDASVATYEDIAEGAIQAFLASMDVAPQKVREDGIERARDFLVLSTAAQLVPMVEHLGATPR
jgi:hypothetical protein